MDKPKASKSISLENLSDSELILADPDLEIRGHKVVDPHGADIGHVSDLFIDTDERKVRMIEIRAGGFLGIGDRQLLIPVDAIVKLEKGVVHVNETRERVAASPAYDPELMEKASPSLWEPYYGYYGLLPYWSIGYSYPSFPTENFPVPPLNAR
jgi:sporulation protein YlmC with PRC-barrel domain